ncbi:phage portal protein [Vitiosangium sp. GDMCC 1.1324]|uniref:phage portal protein n=1 Tax=Vitiosangium sp. (strain GDMCC 1.1324) TaxID=2138576 RepID=UPI00130E18CB|nr:phage portal protein [Vitiosangium sp. GDMCC 1.1324]
MKRFFGALWTGSGKSSRALPRGVPLQPFGVRRGSRVWCRYYKDHAGLRVPVETKAAAAARVRWRVYKPVNKDDAHALSYSWKHATPEERAALRRKALESKQIVEVEGHLVQRLIEDPSPRHPGLEVRKLMCIYLDGPGECFLWLRRAEDGTVVGFEVLPPHAVLTTPTEQQPSYQVSYNLFSGAIPETDIIWLKHLDPENPEGRGAGRGLALGDELDTSEAIQTSMKAGFERGPFPDVIVGIKPDEAATLPPESLVEDATKRFQTEHGSPDKAGKPFFVAGDTTATVIQPNNRNMQTLQIEQALRDFMRESYNVNPEIIGKLASSTRATSEEAKYNLAEHAVLPVLDFLRAGFQKFLVPKVDPDALLDFDDPRPQAFERALAAMTAAPNPAFTMNELRKLAGYPADPELEGKRFLPLPGAQPVQDEHPTEPKNPPPPRGPAAD